MLKSRKVVLLVLAALAVVAIVLNVLFVKHPRASVRRPVAPEKNAYEFCQKWLSPENDLATRLRLLPEIMKFEGYVPPKAPSVPPLGLQLLDAQIMAKVVRVIAVIRMLEGKRDESLRLLESSYRLGQLLCQSTWFIDIQIGAAVRAIAGKALEIHLLNCCETEAEFKQFWETLNSLKEFNVPQTEEELTELEPAPLIVRVMLRKARRENVQVTKTRQSIVDARFELLRVATAARYRFVVLGEFPSTPDQFGPLLGEGFPKDPFFNGPLRFIMTTDSLVCYSVGPDGRDDRVAIEYDPTNGSLSPGDMLMTVPRKREYPFPREGVRASSLEDFSRQFPNGLPLDPFSSSPRKPLGTTSTLAGGIYVYSYGPDVDEFKGQLQGTSHVLQVQYDPTNGITSEGDVFIRIPPR
jgi:hypothetical protein